MPRIGGASRGKALRAALDASAGDEPPGRATRLRRLLHELEYALGMCERAVEGAGNPRRVPAHPRARRGGGGGARGRISPRLSGVLLEEVRTGGARRQDAQTTLRRVRSVRRGEAAAGEAAEEAAAAAMAEETAAAAAAAAAETAADRATERAAAALVRAAPRARGSRSISACTRDGPNARPRGRARLRRAAGARGSQQALHEMDARARWTRDRRGAERRRRRRRGAVYTRAIYDVVVSWSGYISASAAAAPPDEEEDEEEAAYWGVVRYRSTDPAARRSFLRSLWVQAFIAQSCVQGAFSAMHTARTSADWDFQSLMKAVMRIIAVTTTVENQLSEMGGGATFDDGSGMMGTTTTTAEPSSAPLGSAPSAPARGGRRRGAETAAAPEPEQDEPRVHSSGDFGFGGGGVDGSDRRALDIGVAGAIAQV